MGKVVPFARPLGWVLDLDVRGVYEAQMVGEVLANIPKTTKNRSYRGLSATHARSRARCGARRRTARSGGAGGALRLPPQPGVLGHGGRTRRAFIRAMMRPARNCES